MSVLDTSIKFFDKSDGRDKIGKALQNGLRVLAHHYKTAGDDELASKYKKIASSLSEYRSLLKFFKWLKNIKEMQELGAKAMSSGLSLGDTVSLAVEIGDLGYRVGDNIEYLSSYKLLPFDPEQAEKISKTFQFWGYFFSVILDMYELNALKLPKAGEEAKYEKKKMKLMLDLGKDVADFLRVLPQTGYIKFVTDSSNKGIEGTFGTISGLIGTYQVWLKCK